MSMTLFTDEWTLIGTIDPDQIDASPAVVSLTDAIDMSDYDQVAFVMAVGNMSSADNTADFKVTQAATSGGTYKDVTGASVTQITGSPNQDDSQVVVTVDQTALDLDNNYRFVKGQFTPGGSGNIDVCVTVFGRAKHKPGSDSDLATVREIVSV